LILVKSRGVLEIFFTDIDRDLLLLWIQLESFPRHREIFVSYSGKTSEIQYSILDVTVRIDYKILNAPQRFPVGVLDFHPDKLTALEHSALVTCVRKVGSHRRQCDEQHAPYYPCCRASPATVLHDPPPIVVQTVFRLQPFRQRA